MTLIDESTVEVSLDGSGAEDRVSNVDAEPFAQQKSRSVGEVAFACLGWTGAEVHLDSYELVVESPDPKIVIANLFVDLHVDGCGSQAVTNNGQVAASVAMPRPSSVWS